MGEGNSLPCPCLFLGRDTKWVLARQAKRRAGGRGFQEAGMARARALRH